ncbi:MAG: lipocalin family protein [Flavobacteriales bacterium]|nr:lipocalin family protein [Flavobacteriales bacterium]
MRKILTPFLCLFMVACGTGPAPGTPTSAERAPQETIVLRDAGTCAICGTWNATKVTIDGVADPEMDPTGKVEWVIRADSTLSMVDATEGMMETMDGKWRADTKGRLTLFDPEDQEVTEFQVTALNEGTLVMQVLEEEQAEVLLYFVRK